MRHSMYSVHVSGSDREIVCNYSADREWCKGGCKLIIYYTCNSKSSASVSLKHASINSQAYLFLYNSCYKIQHNLFAMYLIHASSYTYIILYRYPDIYYIYVAMSFAISWGGCAQQRYAQQVYIITDYMCGVSWFLKEQRQQLERASGKHCYVHIKCICNSSIGPRIKYLSVKVCMCVYM